MAVSKPFRCASRSSQACTRGLRLGPKDLAAVDSLLVKVTTGQGLDGWGEAFGFTAVPVTQRAIDELIAPLCVGRDATRIAPLMPDVRAKLHVFGQGPVALALSGGGYRPVRYRGQGRRRSAAPPAGRGAADLACYASLDAYTDPSLVRAAVRRALDAGFQSIKLHERSFRRFAPLTKRPGLRRS